MASRSVNTYSVIRLTITLLSCSGATSPCMGVWQVYGLWSWHLAASTLVPAGPCTHDAPKVCWRHGWKLRRLVLTKQPMKHEEKDVATNALAAEAKRKHSGALLALPHVCGVGTARVGDQWVIEVHVEEGAAWKLDLPEELDGVRVRVVEDGPFYAGPARS